MVLQSKTRSKLRRGLTFAAMLFSASANACCCTHNIIFHLEDLNSYLASTMNAEANALERIADVLESDITEIGNRVDMQTSSNKSVLTGYGIGGASLYDSSSKVRKGRLYYKIINTAGYESWGDDCQLLGTFEAQISKGRVLQNEIMLQSNDREKSEQFSDEVQNYQKTRVR